MVQVQISDYTTEGFTGATIYEPRGRYVFFDPYCSISQTLFGKDYRGTRSIPDDLAYDLFPEATAGYRIGDPERF